MPKHAPRPHTFHIPNPKTGRDVELVCDYQGTDEGMEWWRIQAYDHLEEGSTAPRGLVAASQVVFDPPDETDYGNMHEPHAFVWRGGAGLMLYMAGALLAAKRGRRGIRASDTLSHHSLRLWDKMIEHGLAERGGACGPAGCLRAEDVTRWIAKHRAEHP